MKLYNWQFAPNCRRVRMFVLEKNLDLPSIEEVIGEGFRLLPPYVEKWPHAMVPMLELEPAVVSVLLGAVPGVALPLDEELLLVSLGSVAGGGGVLELVDEEVEGSVEDLAASSFLLQAERDRAAIRARAAHCAIGDLIIGNSWVSFRNASNGTGSFAAACGSL